MNLLNGRVGRFARPELVHCIGQTGSRQHRWTIAGGWHVDVWWKWAPAWAGGQEYSLPVGRVVASKGLGETNLRRGWRNRKSGLECRISVSRGLWEGYYHVTLRLWDHQGTAHSGCVAWTYHHQMSSYLHCWPTMLQWKLQESPSSCKVPLVLSTEKGYHYAHLKAEMLIGILSLIAELIWKGEFGAEWQIRNWHNSCDHSTSLCILLHTFGLLYNKMTIFLPYIYPYE